MDSVTLSDRKARGEHAPTRRSALVVSLSPRRRGRYITNNLYPVASGSDRAAVPAAAGVLPVMRPAGFDGAGDQAGSAFPRARSRAWSRLSAMPWA